MPRVFPSEQNTQLDVLEHTVSPEGPERKQRLEPCMLLTSLFTYILLDVLVTHLIC